MTPGAWIGVGIFSAIACIWLGFLVAVVASISLLRRGDRHERMPTAEPPPAPDAAPGACQICGQPDCRYMPRASS